MIKNWSFFRRFFPTKNFSDFEGFRVVRFFWKKFLLKISHNKFRVLWEKWPFCVVYPVEFFHFSAKKGSPKSPSCFFHKGFGAGRFWDFWSKKVDFWPFLAIFRHFWSLFDHPKIGRKSSIFGVKIFIIFFENFSFFDHFSCFKNFSIFSKIFHFFRNFSKIFYFFQKFFNFFEIFRKFFIFFKFFVIFRKFFDFFVFFRKFFIFFKIFCFLKFFLKFFFFKKNFFL